MATTWDTSPNISANITLSNNNLTATCSGTAAGRHTRANISQITGKRYMEVLFSAGVTGNWGIGLVNSSESFTNYVGQTNNSIAYYANGQIFRNGSAVSTIQASATGNTICMAVDLDNQKAWWRTNGGNWNNDVIGNQNPATNTGGTSISLVTGSLFPSNEMETNNAAGTVNFGASAYAQTPPDGFIHWGDPLIIQTSGLVESLSAQLLNAIPPIEIIRSVADDNLLQVETISSATVISRDSAFIIEALASLKKDIPAPIEFITSIKGDLAIPSEIIGSFRDDNLANAEFLRVQTDDIRIQIESLSVLRDDTYPSLESLGIFKDDSSAWMEALPGFRKDYSNSAEFLRTQTKDSLAQVEATSSVTVISRDSLLPIEVLAFLRDDTLSPIEVLASVKRETLQPLEIFVTINLNFANATNSMYVPLVVAAQGPFADFMLERLGVILPFVPSTFFVGVHIGGGLEFQGVTTIRRDASFNLELLSKLKEEIPGLSESLFGLRDDSSVPSETISSALAIQGDSSFQLELLDSLRSDILVPVESITAIQAAPDSQVESSASLKDDFRTQTEDLLSTTKDSNASVELLSVQNDDTLAPLEELGTAIIKGDSIVPLEAQTSIKNDATSQDEELGAVHKESQAPQEFLAAFKDDNVASVEATANFRNDQSVQVESIASTRKDAVVQDEDLLGVSKDSQIQVEDLTSTRRVSSFSLEVPAAALKQDSIAQVESTAASIRDDSIAQMEDLLGVQKDFIEETEFLRVQKDDTVSFVEWLGTTSIMSDSASQLELIRALSADSVVQDETLLGLRQDSILIEEVLQGLRRDAQSPIEFLRNMQRDVSVPSENTGTTLLTIQADLPLEFLSAFKDDNLGIPEALSSLRSNVIATEEYQAGLRRDVQNPTEVLRSVQRDAVANLETAGFTLITFNSAVQTEFLAACLVRRDAPLSSTGTIRVEVSPKLESLRGVSADTINNTEWLGSIIADELSELESLVTVTPIKTDSGFQIEFTVSGITANSGVPFEFETGIIPQIIRAVSKVFGMRATSRLSGMKVTSEVGKIKVRVTVVGPK